MNILIISKNSKELVELKKAYKVKEGKSLIIVDNNKDVLNFHLKDSLTKGRSYGIDIIARVDSVEGIEANVLNNFVILLKQDLEYLRSIYGKKEILSMSNDQIKEACKFKEGKYIIYDVLPDFESFKKSGTAGIGKKKAFKEAEDPFWKSIRNMNEKEFFEFMERVTSKVERDIYKAFRFKNLKP